VENIKSSRSLLEVAISVLYQFMLAAGILIVAFASYLIMGGTIEAIFMMLPGLLTLGGGFVLRKISSANRLA